MTCTFEFVSHFVRLVTVTVSSNQITRPPTLEHHTACRGLEYLKFNNKNKDAMSRINIVSDLTQHTANMNLYFILRIVNI